VVLEEEIKRQDKKTKDKTEKIPGPRENLIPTGSVNPGLNSVVLAHLMSITDLTHSATMRIAHTSSAVMICPIKQHNDSLPARRVHQAVGV
jgi:hypothetical protein